jgi:hypothetical protein
MALLIAIGLELIVAVQSLVFLVAIPAGLLIGWYANGRSNRRRPWWRVVLNAGYASLVTAIGLAILYTALRLLFIYADTGYRDTSQGGPLVCQAGPDCTYQRYLAAGRGADLRAAGVQDAADFEAYVLREQVNGSLLLIGLTLGGGLVGGLGYGILGGKRESGEALAERPSEG